MRRDPEADHALSALVSRTLAAGLASALGAMGLGILLALRSPGPVGPEATPFGRLAAGAAALDPTAWLSLGIALLLATPALRVLVLLGGYLKRRDWALAAVAAAVLAILALSVCLGTGY